MINVFQPLLNTYQVCVSLVRYELFSDVTHQVAAEGCARQVPQLHLGGRGGGLTKHVRCLLHHTEA